MRKEVTMFDEFIQKAMLVAFFEKKQGTSTSYYWQSGCQILPNRISVSKEMEMSSVQKKGRNTHQNVVGQFLAQFTKKEESPLKQYPPYQVRTQLWQVPLYPQFIGYGTIGITGESGKVKGDTGDLIVLYSPDDWNNIVVFFFAGMGSINELHPVMRFLQKEVESGKYDIEQMGNASQHHPSNSIIK